MRRDAEIFAAALELAEGERGAFLERACAGDAALRQEVEALLGGHDQAEGFLATPLVRRRLVAAEEQAGDVIGRYTLRERIGEGGCGTVWLADQREPVRRPVALKVIKLGMDTSEVIARFEAERQALALMRHPNIAQVFDGGATATGRPYFVMELVPGVPLTRYCDDHSLTLSERIELFIHVCHAIEHAHQKGIIHRDLKPSNILVGDDECSGGAVPVKTEGDVARPARRQESSSGPKIIDFGIAKATQGRLAEHTLHTARYHFIGTPVYMSPEQARADSDIDTRSDIYSLGVVLYELLTGHTPFDRDSLSSGGPDDVRERIQTSEPRRPSSRFRTLAGATRESVARLRRSAPAQLESILRGDLDWIVMRCLEKERGRRYASAHLLALDLRRHLDHEPITARPPSVGYVLQKLVRRHRVAFSAAAFVAGAIVVGATLAIWQAVRATQAEREQRRLRVAAEQQELIARRHAYASDMRVLQRAIDGENHREARNLLELQRPLPGQRDLRGWEWRYLWQLCQDDPATVLAQKAQMITGLVVSADERWIAATEDTKLWLIDLQSRQQFELAPRVSRMAFSPREPVLAIAEAVGANGDTHRLRLVNANTRETIREWPLREQCVGLRFSADGRILVGTGMGAANHISVWRVADGALLARHPAATNLELALNILAISGQASAAAYPVSDGRVRLIDLATGAEQWISPRERGEIQSIAFSPDQQILATGAATNRRINPVTRMIDLGDSRINLWDTTTGSHLAGLEGHQGFVRALLFSRDGRRLISGGRDQTIRIWDVASRRLLKTLRGHQGNVSDLALIADDATLISSLGHGGAACG